MAHQVMHENPGSLGIRGNRSERCRPPVLKVGLFPEELTQTLTCKVTRVILQCQADLVQLWFIAFVV